MILSFFEALVHLLITPPHCSLVIFNLHTSERVAFRRRRLRASARLHWSASSFERPLSRARHSRAASYFRLAFSICSK